MSTDDAVWAVHQGLVCPAPRGGAAAAAAAVVGAAAADVDPETGVPRTFDRPTILIWHSATCQACQLSEGVFRALEAAAAAPGAAFRVVRVPARWEVLRRRFTHVSLLPTYDVVYPAPPHEVAPGYGPGLRLRTIPGNDLAALRATFPAAFAARPGPD